jgi:hypothetical protein
LSCRRAVPRIRSEIYAVQPKQKLTAVKADFSRWEQIPGSR